MRNSAPINHFPPTLFSPNRSAIYGGAHSYRAGVGQTECHISSRASSRESGKSQNALALQRTQRHKDAMGEAQRELPASDSRVVKSSINRRGALKLLAGSVVTSVAASSLPLEALGHASGQKWKTAIGLNGFQSGSGKYHKLQATSTR